jgi:hypothetical protein
MNKKNIRGIHLLLGIENDIRETESIKSLEKIKKYIDYIQIINDPYIGDEWKKKQPLGGWMNHGPGHYGAYNSFKKGIKNYFSEDIDGFIIFEGDCILDIEHIRFKKLIDKALDFCIKYELDYFSFGDRYFEGHLNSPEIKGFNNEFRDFIITNKIILTHCILFPAHVRDNLIYNLNNKAWDTPDFWFDIVFQKKGIIKYPITYQYGGTSVIDNIIKPSNYYSNKTREEVIPKILNNNNLKGKGVEIGVYKGEFSKHILKNWEGTLYMVDPWRYIQGYEDILNKSNLNEIFYEALKNTEKYNNRAITIRCYSHQAVELFEDNSLDFVYIDGDHSYKSVKRDLELWFPKLRKGGLFAGHDYLKLDWSKPPYAPNKKDKYIWSNPSNKNEDSKYIGLFGVNPAVDEFCEKHNIKFNLTKEWTSTWLFFK